MAPGLWIRFLPFLMWFSSKLTSDVSSSLSSGCLTMYPFDRDLHFSLLVGYRCQILNLVACVSHSNDSSVKKSHQGDLKRKFLHNFVWNCWGFFVFTPSTFWHISHLFISTVIWLNIWIQIQLTGNLASMWGRRNTILCFVRQLRAFTDPDLHCWCGLCLSSKPPFLSLPFFSFLFFFLLMA